MLGPSRAEAAQSVHDTVPAVALLDDRFRDLVGEHVAILALLRGLRAFVAVAEESALDQDRRINRIAKHPKIRGLHAAVARPGQGQQLALDAIGQTAGVTGECIVGFEPTNAAAARIIEMNADKDGVLLPVADGGPLVEGNEDVARCAS